MSFIPLQNLLPRAANHFGMSRQMEAAKVCHDFRSVLTTLIPNIPEAPDNISPAHYQKGTLTINTTSPAWAQEVITRKPKIIEALNEKAGKEIIKNLQLQVRIDT